jgi:hypothetical protein
VISLFDALDDDPELDGDKMEHIDEMQPPLG